MPNSVERVEVFSGIQRRRRYTLEQKLATVAEASPPGMSISFVARRHGISQSLLFGWRRRMAEGGKEAVRVDDEVVASAEVKALEKRIRELERVLGKKTLENEILREAVKVAHEKKLISRLPLLPDEDTPGGGLLQFWKSRDRSSTSDCDEMANRGCATEKPMISNCWYR